MSFRQKCLLCVLVLGIFCSGLVAGWFVRPVVSPPETATSVVVEKRLPSPSKTLASLDERLKFSDEQKRALQPIIEEWAREARAAEMPMREKRYAAFRVAVPRIREVLDGEQQALFDKITGAADAEWERRTKSGTE